MKILGISAFYHDSAAALIDGGRIVAAAQEERFTRVKHDPYFPAQAIQFCLKQAGCGLDDVDHVVFYEKPFLKFERLLETYMSFAPRGFLSFKTSMPLWIKEKLFQKDILIKELKKISPDYNSKNLLFSEHHFSHAASAFFPSPYEEAVVLTLDGVGEWATGSVALGSGNGLEIIKELHFPHSLGLLYSAFTYYLGFKVNSGEYKVMGLAPYGEAKYASLILDTLIDLKEDGSFMLDMSYFNYCTGLTMVNKKFCALFAQNPRRPETDPLTQFHMDVAASIQAVTEIVVLKIARAAQQETGMKNLCLAGGVALNCVANGVIARENIFENIWVQPAAGDAGGALGAALAAYYSHHNQPRKIWPQDDMQGSYLGPAYVQSDIEARLKGAGACFSVLSDDDLMSSTVKALTEQKAVGWMQGRAEFGPRALGNRSILGDPRSPSMQKILNLKIKYRESFRPFAPSVLSEDVSEWFDYKGASPYMLMIAPVAEKHRYNLNEVDADLTGIEKLNASRSDIPAVTHVDYSARLQTVHKETNPRYYALISAFKAQTGCGVLINTSFNVRGEPIINTPEDAFRCFMGSEMDVLVVGNCFLMKEEQDPALKLDYKNEFDHD